MGKIEEMANENQKSENVTINLNIKKDEKPKTEEQKKAEVKKEVKKQKARNSANRQMANVCQSVSHVLMEISSYLRNGCDKLTSSKAATGSEIVKKIENAISALDENKDALKAKSKKYSKHAVLFGEESLVYKSNETAKTMLNKLNDNILQSWAFMEESKVKEVLQRKVKGESNRKRLKRFHIERTKNQHVMRIPEKP